MKIPGLKSAAMTACRVAAGALTVVAVLAARSVAGEAGCPLEIVGVTVTPHVGTPGVRFRQPPLALDARVQLFVNEAPT
jgi:hypothetical protein